MGYERIHISCVFAILRYLSDVNRNADWTSYPSHFLEDIFVVWSYELSSMELKSTITAFFP